jgi:hypothetical protein
MSLIPSIIITLEIYNTNDPQAVTPSWDHIKEQPLILQPKKQAFFTCV